ncbi:MAG: hypothetical protein GTN81_05350 [Proteobacteria bacterium]|nr:hypothetical protein [Pseudomonadota bacterium]
MLWRTKKQQKDERWKLQNLCYLIAQLDSIRAFKRVELTEVEKSFEEIGSMRLWEEIRPHLEKIVYFPQTLPKVLKLMQIALVLRRLFPICLFSVVLVMLDKAGIIPLPISPIASFFFLFVPIAILFGFVYVDLFIRRIIIKYERDHPNMQSKQKAHIKKVIEKLIMNLLGEIHRFGGRPHDHKMKLFFDDYEGMKIVREIKRRLLIRKYPAYLAIPFMTDR